MTDENDFVTTNADALLDCDIVMAGGVTSGIIYPGAVAMIARRYSFRCIGGTSVGAIAAAITAAAEYGRRTGKNQRAFDDIGTLSRSLGDEADDRHTRLFHLFTPQTSTKPLLALLTPVLAGNGWLRKAWTVFGVTLSAWQIALPVAVAALAGVYLTSILLISGRPILSVIAVIAAMGLIIVVWLLTLGLTLSQRWLIAWRNNYYGICTGLVSPTVANRPTQSPFEGLTPWMHAAIQRAAGRELNGAPLTFGDLWGAPSAIGEAGGTKPDAAAPRSIELAMIASDISRNRTTQIPFLESPSPLYVEERVLEDFFPETIVRWMKDHAGTAHRRVEKRHKVFRLPKPQYLPVVFGARLSLSFPVLLSAMPLMTPDYAKAKKGEPIPLRRVWFSDGGLTSNFPIHFFDSPVPSRPTFCLNLVGYDTEAPNVATNAADDEETTERTSAREVRELAKPIAQPRASERKSENRPTTQPKGDPKPGDKVWGFISMSKGGQVSQAPFTSFDGVAGSGVGAFLNTLLNTARFWSDNQMLIAPGVRERVVNIALCDDEGGLNLDMKANVIADLDLRGRAAGMLIASRFDPDAVDDPETGEKNTQIFASHRWIRFRNFMAAFEDLSRRFAISRRKSDMAAAVRDESLLNVMIAGNAKEKIGYPAPVSARDFYRGSTDTLEEFALQMADATRSNPDATFDSSRTGSGTSMAPRPKMRLRLRPLADTDPRDETADLPNAPVMTDRTESKEALWG